jgi:hypothetical protein
LQARERRDEFPEGLLLPVTNEKGVAVIATFKGAFHGFHYIVDMAGGESIFAAVDEGELPGLYGTEKPCLRSFPS